MITPQAFLDAVTQGDRPTIEEMLSSQPELVHSRSANGVSAILLAVYYGMPDMAHFLIAHGANPDIFEASATGLTKRVQDLLEADPSLVNAVAADGYQPLGLASFFGHSEAARYLVEHGAQVNSASRNGQRVMPLHSAAAGQHLEIARLLLENGADPNAVQADDFTPLHAAADNGQVEMVKLLLSCGADPGLKMRGGQTAYDLASAKGHTEAASLLKASAQV